MSIDLIVFIVLIVAIFLRQIVISKRPLKINYAPLVLVLGMVGAITHLFVSSKSEEFLIVFRESMLPVFVALVIYIVMNFIQQVQKSQESHESEEKLQDMDEDIESLRRFLMKLDSKIDSINQQEVLGKEQLDSLFKEDLEALQAIQHNQSLFLGKFEDIFSNQTKLISDLDRFVNQDLPDIDTVIHKHIDLLRIEEKDHFNKIKQSLDRGLTIDKKFHDELISINSTIENFNNTYKQATKNIVQTLSGELSLVIEDFEAHMNMLRAKSDALSTALSENDKILGDARKQSEVIIKQMVLSSDHLEDVALKSERLKELYSPLVEITQKISDIRIDYVSAKAEMMKLSDMVKEAENESIEKVQLQIAAVAIEFQNKLNTLLASLNAQPQTSQQSNEPTSIDITKTMKELSTKAQLQKSYQSD